jgi:hypothetical protein
MKKEELLQAIARVREEWRAARTERLSRKRELLVPGHDMSTVRRDRLYRDLQKRQRRFAVLIVHLERRMNRIRAREKEK